MTTITLDDTAIDHLIGARNRMTDRMDELIDFCAVDHIDAVLATVPHGARADVDALLGRKRIIAVQHRDGTREVDPSLMTMPQIIAGRAAAGLRDSDEMRREMCAARSKALTLAAEKVREFEAHIAELTENDIALMNARCDETASETNEIYLRRME